MPRSAAAESAPRRKPGGLFNSYHRETQVVRSILRSLEKLDTPAQRVRALDSVRAHVIDMPAPTEGDGA